MRLHGIAIAVVLGAIVSTTMPAHAQIAGAIGKPLESSDTPPNEVVVRLIAGALSAPVVSTEVTLVVNGQTRNARTDAGGRAHFPNLPAGATVQAKAVDADGKEMASEEFQLSDKMGIHVMLTTKPFQGGGGGAPFAGGGMPTARQMSGEPRFDQAFPAGTITAIVTYNSLKMSNNKLVDPEPPVGIDVMLVGYHSDDKVTVQTVKTNGKGEALFDSLDATGNTTYFAMTRLPRNGVVDRLVSSVMQLESQAGVRVVLSSEKKDSTDPVIDDISKIAQQEPATADANKLRVIVDGVEPPAAVVLIDAATGQKIGEAQTQQGAPDPAKYQAAGHFDVRADLPAGTLDVEVKGGPGTVENPIPDVDVRVVDATQKEIGTGGMATKTGDTGTVRMSLAPDKKLKAVITLYGKPLVSQPLQLDKQGGKITVIAHWQETGEPEAYFDVKPGQVVYAEISLDDDEGKSHTFRSAPVLPVEGHGTTVAVAALKRVAFRFHMGAIIDDEFLGVQAEIEIDNYSWTPYSAGPDGLLIPLPKHFKGANVDKSDQSDVAVDQGNGFRIMRPLGPGKRVFHGVFSLPVSSGTVDWALDLPFGAVESNLNILQFPGMDVQLPPGTTGGPARAQNGKAMFAIPNIKIDPNHSMALTINGLPSMPAWKVWLPRIAGLLVIIVLVSGVVLAIVFGRRRAAVDPGRGTRRAKLLDELVEIDRTGKDNKRRDAVLAELEKLWED